MKTIRIKIIGGQLKITLGTPKFGNSPFIPLGGETEWARGGNVNARLSAGARTTFSLPWQTTKFMNAPLAVALLGLLLLSPKASAQGLLTPPGAPVAGMKTLSQVEARTAITNTTTPVIISQPGSYYLTANITLTAGDAITIATNNVMLDLNGFTLSTTAAGGSGTAIAINNAQNNITIRNGFITSGITNDGVITYGGSGFARGISALAALANGKVTDVNIHGCLLSGITLGAGTGTVVRRCTVNNVGWVGITADMVVDCMADVGGYGSNPAIQAGTIINSRGLSHNGNGINATQLAENSTGASTSSVGFTSVLALNCNGTSTAQTGLIATMADNCVGNSTGSTGASCYLANNCVGTTASINLGFYISYLATGCYGASASPTQGIYSLFSLNSCAGTFTSSTYKYNMP